MTALRWILGLVAAFFGGGLVFLGVLSNAFRKSFGASEHGPLFIGLPVAAIGLLLAAILVPACKPLPHIATAAPLGLAGFCLWQIFAHSEIPLWFAVAYLMAWFVYYWLAAWRVSPPS